MNNDLKLIWTEWRVQGVICQNCNFLHLFLTIGRRRKYVISNMCILYILNRQPYTCNGCNKAFSVIQNLTRHKKICKSLEPPIKETFPCRICWKVFQSKGTSKPTMRLTSWGHRQYAHIVETYSGIICPYKDIKEMHLLENKLCLSFMAL